MNVNFYSPIPRVPRDDSYLVVSALVPYKRIDQAVAACAQSGRRLIVIGEGPERARLEAMAGPTVRFLGWQPDDGDWQSLPKLPRPVVSRRRGFRDRPDRGPRLRCTGDRARRGGVAETVDATVGRTYAEPTPAALLARSTPGKPRVARTIRSRHATGRGAFRPCFETACSSSSPRS